MKHAALLLLVVATSSSCATDRGEVHLAAAGPATVGQASAGGLAAWREVVAHHTRRVEVYDWLMRQADLRATLVTPRLRAAFIEHAGEFHGRFSHDLGMELQSLGKKPDDPVGEPMTAGPAAENEVLFFVAMYVADQKHRDISLRTTIWDTRLVRGDVSVRPLAIEPVRYTPAVVELFPFADRFDDLYLVRFPLVDAASGRAMMTPGDPPLELRVSSALADARVQWSLVE